MHPPTAYCFCKHILFLLPTSLLAMDVRYEILELARFLTELSVIDYYFVVHRPSDVALAALLIASEAVNGSSEATSIGLGTELRRIRGGSDPNKPEVLDCRTRLQILYSHGDYSRPDVVPNDESRDETVSPVCVSFAVHSPEVQSSSERYGNHDQLGSAGGPLDMSINETDGDFDIADITLRNLDFGIEDNYFSKANNIIIISSSSS
jgi:Cyclin, C-terminal domain